MTTRTPATRRALALLAIPLLIILSGCKSISTIDIKDEQNITVKMDTALTAEQASKYQMTKDKLCSSSAEANKSFKDLKQTAYEENGMVGCRFEGTTTLEKFNGDSSAPSLKHDKDKKVWTFKIPKSSSTEGNDQLAKEVTEFKFALTFPGEVTKATKGKKSGNTVTFTDIKEFMAGDIDVEAKDIDVEAKDIDVEAKDSAGIPWLPILLGLLGLALLGGLAWYFMNRNKKTAPVAHTAYVEQPAANPSDPVVTHTTSTHVAPGSQYGTAPTGPVDAPTQRPEGNAQYGQTPAQPYTQAPIQNQGPMQPNQVQTNQVNPDGTPRPTEPGSQY